MAIADICLGQSDIPGAGGVAGGGTDSPAMRPAGYTSYTGFPVMTLMTAQNKTVTMQLFDSMNGTTPADLTGYDSLTLYAKELPSDPLPYFAKTATVLDATAGLISFTFVPGDLRWAGVFWAGVIAKNSSNQNVADWSLWVEVRKGINHQERINTPISIAEIRLVLRDASPEANELLLTYEFSDTEIAFAITRPIEQWNEIPPPVMLYTPATFPFREHWRKAAAGILLRSAAIQYARNDLQYQAGGMSVQDKDKLNQYEKLGQTYQEEWIRFCETKKYQMNMEKAFFSLVRSPYA